jgi:amino acid adenylation domain-containing protein
MTGPDDTQAPIARRSGPRHQRRDRPVRDLAPSDLAAGPPRIEAPLSWAQERLLFLQGLDPTGSSYHRPLALALHGPLAPAGLRAALARVIDRHAALRITIHPAEGGARQRLAAPWTPALDRRDLSAAADPDAAQASEMAAEIARPFDLERGPVLRAALWRLARHRHVLLLVVHHVTFDAWSAERLVQELAEGYAAEVRGQPPRAPALRYTVLDHAAWERGPEGEAAIMPAVAAAAARLAAIPLLDLPVDRPRPPVQAGRGARVEWVVAGAEAGAVQGLGRSEGCTPFMVWLAGLAALLARACGAERLAIAVPTAGRSRLDLEPLIGCFAETLVLPMDVSGNPSFVELLARSRAATLTALDGPVPPFARVVETLTPPRDASRSPLATVMLNLRPPLPQRISAGGLVFKPLPAHAGGAPFDLTLELERVGGEGWRAALVYDRELFVASTVARWRDRLRRLLAQAATDPGRRLSAFELAGELEQAQLAAWSRGPRATPSGTLGEKFAQRCEETPAAVALRCEGQAITYRQLGGVAGAVARELVALGAGPGRPVAVLASRSWPAFAGLIGVLQAGSTYLALDPELPDARLAWLLDDARPLAVLVAGNQRARLARLWRGPVLDIGGDRAPAPPPPATAGPDDPAWLIYTSGSTGQPKGVLGSHRGALVRCEWMWHRYPFEPGELACQRTSLAFVDHVWELFGPLLAGVPSLVVPDTVARDVGALAALLAAERVTRLVAVPSLLSGLADAPGGLPPLAALRVVTASGEALGVPLAQRWLSALPTTRLLNIYGTTEVSADATCCDLGETSIESTVPIGRPIDGARVHVLDPLRRPVPIGWAGEIYVGGTGLSPGYHRAPELTAAAFVDDPFEPGARLYRTGDRGRWREDGQLEWLGRVDGQLSRHGVRIEPAEIEAALREHPGVTDAVVVLAAHPPGEAQLVAWVEGAVDPPALRAHLAHRLPHASRPDRVAVTPRLPRTASGKADRVRLAATPAPVEPLASGEPPADALEGALARLFEELLGVSGVGRHDDWFALGGHSLRAVVLFNRIAALAGRRLPLATLFEASTVAELARCLREAGWRPPWQTLVRIQKGRGARRLFCLHAVGGDVLVYRELARLLGPARPVDGLQDTPALRPAGPIPLPEVAAGYLARIRERQPRAPYLLCGLSGGGHIAFEIALQLQAQGERVALLALLDTAEPGYMTRRLGHGRRRRAYQHLAVTAERLDGLACQLWQVWRSARRRTVRQSTEEVRRIVRETFRRPVPAPGVQDWPFAPWLPTARFRGRLTLLRGWRPLGALIDRHLGWGPHVEEVELRLVPGFHAMVLHPPHVTHVARELAGCLARVDRQAGESDPPDLDGAADPER